MTQLRQDPLAGHWVIISEDRASRPIRVRRSEIDPQSGWLCPFCEGNESTTPPELEARRPANSPPNTPGWSIRAVANKFPALRPEADPSAAASGLLECMEGYGAHELIIESPQHRAQIVDFSESKIADILRIYRSRLAALYRDERIGYVQIFRNEGYMAGASLEHPHSQILAMPFAPPHIRTLAERSRAHDEKKRGCLTCAVLKQELKDGGRVIFQEGDFVALAPYASRVPGEIAVFPIKHGHRFEEATDAQLGELAATLRRSFWAIKQTFDTPPFNFVLVTAPQAIPKELPEKQLARTLHWYFLILPRTARPDGIEWATGVNLNPLAPETAARQMRRALEERRLPAGSVKR